MNVWTVLIALLACAAIVVGCIAVSVLAIGVGVVYLISVVGIWTGKPERKWYLVAVFAIAFARNVYVIATAPYSALTLVLTIASAFLVVRFFMWRPSANEPNQSATGQRP